MAQALERTTGSIGKPEMTDAKKERLIGVQLLGAMVSSGVGRMDFQFSHRIGQVQGRDGHFVLFDVSPRMSADGLSSSQAEKLRDVFGGSILPNKDSGTEMPEARWEVTGEKAVMLAHEASEYMPSHSFELSAFSQWMEQPDAAVRMAIAKRFQAEIQRRPSSIVRK
ncbi:MAG: hypothetical protein ACM3IJ_04335 [Candidatus Levyibacteriota bacterium]